MTDIVITHVDFACIQWRAEYERAIHEVYDPTIHTCDSATRTRFANHGELRFLLRSVNAHMPWVRTIYIVVDDCLATPSWINETANIKMVRHSELFMNECLPTFNSQAIETVIHRIPGISDPFIYFNDDMFVGRPIDPGYLIQPGQKCAVLLTTDYSKCGTPSVTDIGFRCAWKNVNRILDERFSPGARYKLEHAPYVISPRLMEEIWAAFHDEMECTMRSRFRSIHDVNVSPALHPYYALHTDAGFVQTGISVKTLYLDMRDAATTRSKLSSMSSTELPHFFCIEDEDGHSESDNLIRQFLESHFPHASVYETETDCTSLHIIAHNSSNVKSIK